MRLQAVLTLVLLSSAGEALGEVSLDRAPRPIRFEPNVGQLDGRVSFAARGQVAIGKGTLYFAEGLRISLVEPRDTELEGLSRLASVSHHLVGDPSQFRTNIPNYARIQQPGVFEGIDWEVHGTFGKLEHDFVVAPNADPSLIRFRIEGAKHVEIDTDGSLIAHADQRRIVQAPPIAYQHTGNGCWLVDVDMALDEAGEISFHLGDYDREAELIIDPVVLEFSTLLGGGDVAGLGERAWAMDTDSTGAIIIAGGVRATDFPIVGGVQDTIGGLVDGFVTKIAPDGKSLIFSTYFGGNGDDEVFGLAVDSNDNIVIGGYTESQNLVQVNEAQPAWGGGINDGFMAKLGSNGASIVFSTFVGGRFADEVRAVAVDGNDRAYATGITRSDDFPVSVGAPQDTGNNVIMYNDAWIGRWSAAGAVEYATYLGGSTNDEAFAIAVDGVGAAYAVGLTASSDFPTISAFQPGLSGGAFTDGFVTKIDATGTSFEYSTYIGGEGSYDDTYGVVVDGSGRAHVVGRTGSSSFPATAGSYQETYHLSQDAYFARLSADGATLEYASYLGGGSDDVGRNIALDSMGRIYLAGWTTPTHASMVNFPFFDQLGAGTSHLVFVSRFDSTGLILEESVVIGGQGQEEPYGIVVDDSGNVWMGGWTTSNTAQPFPTTPGAYDETANADEAFALKLSFSGMGGPDGGVNDAGVGADSGAPMDAATQDSGGPGADIGASDGSAQDSGSGAPDAGSSGNDAGTTPILDSGSTDQPTDDGEGCGCSATPQPAPSLGLWALVVLLFRWRRRSGR